MLYNIRVYCPYDFSETSFTVEAVSAEIAREKAVGKVVTCPKGDRFEVEEWSIISVVAIEKPVPIIALPYKVMTEEAVKRAKWLLGATVDKPLPIGATPVGSPKLKRIDYVGELAYYGFEHPIESKAVRFLTRYPEFEVGGIKYGPYAPRDVDYIPYMPKVEEMIKAGVSEWAYPEFKATLFFSRAFFTKFVEEAKRMAREKKIHEAIQYFIEHEPTISVPVIAAVLELPLFRVYREVAEMVHPSPEVAEEIEEQAKVFEWAYPTEVEEAKAKAKTLKPAKIMVNPMAPRWRGMTMFISVAPKKEEELLEELARIKTLEERRTPTRKDITELKRFRRRKRMLDQQSKILSWFEK